MAEAGACGAQRASAVFGAKGARARIGREFYRVLQADLGELWVGPRPGRLGLFAVRARRRLGGAAGRPAVRPLRAPPRLFAWTAAAWRRVFGRGLFRAALAVPV